MCSQHFNIGVIGLELSGRSHLINALKENLAHELRSYLIFHKLDYPDKGRSQTNQQRYDEYMKELKQQHDLSLLLVTVPDSFRDKEASLICAAKNNALSAAIVVPNLDTSLNNLNPMTKKFTDAEKVQHVLKEQNYIKRVLHEYGSGENVNVFQISYECFPTFINHHSSRFAQDELKLCKFVQHFVNSNSQKPLKNDHTSSQDGAIKSSYETPVDTEGLPDTYDILLIGYTSSHVRPLRNFFQKTFKGISIQKIETNDDTAEKTIEKIGGILSKVTIIIIKDKFDEKMVSVIKDLDNNNRKFKTIFDTTDANAENSFFAQFQTIINMNSVVPINLEKLDIVNIDNENIQQVFKFIQEHTGKSYVNNVLNSDLVKSYEKSQFDHDITIIGFHGTNLSAVSNIILGINHNLDIKVIKYAKNYYEKEIAEEIKTGKMVILVVPHVSVNQYSELLRTFAEQGLEFKLILDNSNSVTSGNYTIEKTNQCRCFTLSQSNANVDDMFVRVIKNIGSIYVNTSEDNRRDNDMSTTV